MKLSRMMIVAGIVTAFAACGTDEGNTGAGDGGNGGGEAGSGGGEAGAGGGEAGSGGGGGSGGIGGDADACVDLDLFFAEKVEPFAMAAFAGGSRFVDGVEHPLEVGFDDEANVFTYNVTPVPPALAGKVTTIELWGDTGGGMVIRVPESGFMVFQIYENDPVESRVRVRRTKDWLTIASPSFTYALHVSTGRELGGALEAIPGGGPTLRPALQCRLSDDACSVYALAFDGTLGTEQARAKSGWPIDDLGKTDKGTVWSIRNSSGARDGTCGDPRVAQVIGVWNFRWNQ